MKHLPAPKGAEMQCCFGPDPIVHRYLLSSTSKPGGASFDIKVRVQYRQYFQATPGNTVIGLVRGMISDITLFATTFALSPHLMVSFIHA